MKWNYLRKYSPHILNTIVITFLLILPYFLFKGKLFLGGDDTRLFYVYPQEYLKNIPLFSWINLSSVGWNFSYQSFIPFVLLWSFLEILIKSKIILGYFSFSLPFILGFIFFQKFALELVEKDRNLYKGQVLLGSLFYIFSPIILQNHFLNPLIPIWLIGLIPGICYFFLRFLKTDKFEYVLFSTLYVIIFSFGVHNIPWILGFFIPLGVALFVGCYLYERKEIFLFLKRLIIFSIIILFSQSFWLMGFLVTLTSSSANSFTAKAVSKEVVGDFANAIKVTSSGKIIYPLLNFYHRQIAFDFNWNLKNIFLSLYDKTYFINVIYVCILLLGIVNFKKVFNNSERKIFIIVLISFVISLYLFTVNIGPLLNLYIQFGRIPGFGLFRNPYDKFAMGYSLIYSLLITLCLVVLRKKFGPFPLYRISSFLFLLVILINAFPIKSIIVSPLWTTSKIYKNILIPQEYVSFMKNVEKAISPTNNILSIPYGVAQYTVIKDSTSNNVYAGISPVIIFSGINDISGNLSFNYGPEANIVDSSIADRKYDVLNRILYAHNINYVFLTKNIPDEVKKSYLYAPNVIKAQDRDFLVAITDGKILSSSNGNYDLYTTKRKNALISSDNLVFKRISKVKYEILVKNLKEKQKLFFNDTFNDGWNLYLQPVSNQFNCRKPQITEELKTTECVSESRLFEISDLSYLWRRELFSNTHKVNGMFANEWIIDPDYVKKNFDSKMYSINNDGSMNIKMTLYYRPQEYFYLGTGISIITVAGLIILVIRRKR